MRKLLGKFFPKKQENPVRDYAGFWAWFVKNQKKFYDVIKEDGDLHKDFFSHLAPQLNAIKEESIWYLCGMFDNETAELILTADGDVCNIAFAEELAAAAPHINGWRITALKPEYKVEDCNINMDGYEFSRNTLHFYANELDGYPDEIDITLIHRDYTEENKADIATGSYIFLDHYLGELRSATVIDNITFQKAESTSKELIPIERLKSYLIWREKEFVEKYENVSPDVEETFSVYEGKMRDGSPYIGTINANLLAWENKASHPWFVVVKQEFDSENGMPDGTLAEQLNSFEDRLLDLLKPSEGHLYIGRETNEGVREIYFACRDFRKASKMLYDIEKTYSLTKSFSFQIYKDKYWKTLRHYMQ